MGNKLHASTQPTPVYLIHDLKVQEIACWLWERAVEADKTTIAVSETMMEATAMTAEADETMTAALEAMFERRETIVATSEATV